MRGGIGILTRIAVPCKSNYFFIVWAAFQNNEAQYLGDPYYTFNPKSLMPQFEWDENKNSANKKKHKIAFEDAVDVFNDKDRLKFGSIQKGEKRYLTIGKAFLAIISVVYTTRNMIVRIISARRASKEERKAYLTKKLSQSGNDNP